MNARKTRLFLSHFFSFTDNAAKKTQSTWIGKVFFINSLLILWIVTMKDSVVNEKKVNNSWMQIWLTRAFPLHYSLFKCLQWQGFRRWWLSSSTCQLHNSCLFPITTLLLLRWYLRVFCRSPPQQHEHRSRDILWELSPKRRQNVSIFSQETC